MKHNFLLKRTAAVLLAAAVLLSLIGCSSNAPNSDLKPLTVTLLKVGKADAVIALCDDHALLIDAGEEDDGQEVVDFLKKRVINEIDALIITHFDQDHVGGADTVLENIPVKTVYVPDYESSNTEYIDFAEAAKKSEVPVQRLTEPVSFCFRDVDVLIEPPKSYGIKNESKDYDNNFSLITTLTHGDNSLVFTGDAEKARIREWLSEKERGKCDFLKVPHHGIYNGALDELFSALEPDFSVICSSKKHPAETRTLELLKEYCPNIFETRNGNVLVISDGNKLEVQQKVKL